MKIKSLLIGSAAAVIAATGARAADAVVIPEPEAVEYVRVCDAAGTGYFYIPGGETCLKISGYVQYQIGFREDIEGWDKATEGRLLIESYTDSDFGDVTTTMRLTTGETIAWEDDNGNGIVDPDEVDVKKVFVVDRAYMSIGGLSMGLMGNLFDFSETGAFDDYVDNGSAEEAMQYDVDLGAVSFGVQLLVPDLNTSWVPDVVAKASFSVGDADLAAAVAYDDSADAFSVKGTASYAGVGLVVQYADVASDYSGENQWVIGANYEFDPTEKLTLNIGGAFATGDFGDDAYGVGVEGSYDLTDTFTVSSRVRYFEKTNDDATWDGRVRFKASF